MCLLVHIEVAHCEVMGGEFRTGRWDGEEDRKLREYVAKHGAKNWGYVQKMVGLNRSGKSCFDRWTYYLDPKIKTDDFSDEEKKLIIGYHYLYGNRWSAIARFVKGRSPVAVRNFVVSLPDEIRNFVVSFPENGEAQALASLPAAADDMEYNAEIVEELLAGGDSGLPFDDYDI